MFTNSLSKATYAAMLAAGISLCGAQAEGYESLQRFCEYSWQRAGIPRQDWTDCTHDTIVELISDYSEKASSRELESERQLKRCIWRVAKRWQRERYTCRIENCDPSVIACQHNLDGNCRQIGVEDSRLAAALGQLSPTQREIVQRWSAGQTVKQIADEMAFDSGKVSNLKYKALQRISGILNS
ncbi:MAG: sigma-70 family RNA polymerase sigma factor [Planctomycetales bacterium]|nr:sigma-70 family RNA polymerase sigma factor [Planctomycetales bacterium]